MNDAKRVREPSPIPDEELKNRPGTRVRRALTSAELFGGSREIDIRHADAIYTLRQTTKGKLILTK